MIKIIKKNNNIFSPTKLRNYILNNTFVEQFSSIRTESYLAELGNKFEKKVNDYILNKFPNDTILINRNYSETIKAIENNVPIILQGQLEFNNIKGIPDIIIKSNYIPKLIKNYSGTIDSYYRIIDIKFMTLKLSVDKSKVLKSQLIDLYKSQVILYNELLNEVQGYKSNECYLLGRRWKTNNEFNNNCFDFLGTINVDDVDKTKLAIINYNNNYISPFPNMKVPDYFDNGNTELKIEEAKKNNEITSVYYCSTRRRDLALELGISKWNDPNCNSFNLGFNQNSNIGKSVDNILECNRSEDFKIIYNQLQKSIPNKTDVEYFIDFEIANDIVLEDFSQFPNAISESRIYIIGILMVKNNFYKFDQFISDNMSLNSEKRIIDKLFNHLYLNGNGNIFHWGHIERSELKRSQLRHNKNRWNIPEMIDFCAILKEHNVAIKGSMNYSLKNIARALYSEGQIPEIWNSNNQSGKDSTLSIKKIINESNKISDHKDTNDLLLYNKLDCSIMENIICYFRNL